MFTAHNLQVRTKSIIARTVWKTWQIFQNFKFNYMRKKIIKYIFPSIYFNFNGKIAFFTL